MIDGAQVTAVANQGEGSGYMTTEKVGMTDSLSEVNTSVSSSTVASVTESLGTVLKETTEAVSKQASKHR